MLLCEITEPDRVVVAVPSLAKYFLTFLAFYAK